MSDHETETSETHGNVQRLMGRMQILEDNMNSVAQSIDSLTSTLKWHNRIGAPLVAVLAAILGWLGAQIYELNGTVRSLESLVEILTK